MFIRQLERYKMSIVFKALENLHFNEHVHLYCGDRRNEVARNGNEKNED